MTENDPIAPHGGTLVNLLADGDAAGAALGPRPPTCPRSW